MVADLEDREQYIDYLNKEISKYIVHLMTTEMTIQDSQKLNAYYRIIGDLERIGDHAINFVDYLHNMSEWDIKFSQSAIESLEQMKDLCTETFRRNQQRKYEWQKACVRDCSEERTAY